MPDAPSPFDDPFADLFGKLPDPRERRSSGDDAARGTAAPVTPAGTGAQGTAPLSRREAREAAAAPTGSGTRRRRPRPSRASARRRPACTGARRGRTA